MELLLAVGYFKCSSMGYTLMSFVTHQVLMCTRLGPKLLISLEGTVFSFTSSTQVTGCNSPSFLCLGILISSIHYNFFCKFKDILSHYNYCYEASEHD